MKPRSITIAGCTEAKRRPRSVTSLAATAAKPIVSHAFLTDANVSVDQPREAALRVRPGEITDQALENETGGGGLRYSFGVKANGVVYEVGSDARTGAVIEIATKGPHPD